MSGFVQGFFIAQRNLPHPALRPACRPSRPPANLHVRMAFDGAPTEWSEASKMYPITWRARLLADKFRGYYPNTRFGDLAFGLLPGSLLRLLGRERTPITAIGTGTGACAVLWQTPIGSFWGREGDDEALKYIVVEQLSSIYSQPPADIHPGDIVIDLGAHVGSFARIAIDRGAEKVISFEPNPISAECFAQNFATEIESGQVVLIQAAAWDEAGSLEFDRGGTRFGPSESPSSTAISVTARTIDEVVESLSLPRVDFIKADSEGSERHALRGAQAVLSKHKPRMAICVYHLPDDKEVITGVITGADPSYKHFFAHDDEVGHYY